MNTLSAFNTGVQGFQRATEQANQAAADIASAEQFSQSQAANQSHSSNDGHDHFGSTGNLTDSIVQLKVAEYQAKASAQVVQSADEVLGTLLDVSV